MGLGLGLWCFDFELARFLSWNLKWNDRMLSLTFNVGEQNKTNKTKGTGKYV